MRGDLLASVGRLPEAIAAFNHATDLDPLDPSLWTELGRKYMADGQLDRARQALNRALELAPDDPDASGNLALAFVLDGRPDDALAITQRYRGDEVRRLVALALAHHDLGHARKSQRALDALVAGHPRDAAFEIAEIHAWRRENDRAFAWLEKARANRSPRLQFVRCDPLLRELRTTRGTGRCCGA